MTTWAAIGVSAVVSFAAGVYLGLAASTRCIEGNAANAIARIVPPIESISGNCSKMRDDCLKMIDTFKYLEMAVESRRANKTSGK